HRAAFTGFDRDGDGFLNGYEVQFIFSAPSLAALLQNGFYAPNPNSLPTLDKLDTDADRRVSFDEYLAYYAATARHAVRAFPPFPEDPFSARTTEALFAFLDRNKDGKLARDEVEAVEGMLATRDADEDE